MKLKFKVGDYIVSHPVDTQRYIVIDIIKDKGMYCCVDALIGREGYKGILFKEHLGWGSEKDYVKIIPGNDKNMLPCVMDEYCDKFKLPDEWRYSNRNNK